MKTRRFYLVESISKDIYFVPDEILHITDNREEHDKALQFYQEKYFKSTFVEIHPRLVKSEIFKP